MPTALLLAAGESRRMGTPKPLLMLSGEPLVARLERLLLAGGCGRVVTIVAPGPSGEAIARLVAEPLVNPNPSRGMLSSVQVGLRAPGDLAGDAFVVCPCDLPLLSEEDVCAIVSAWSGEAREIVAPRDASGRRGHPTLFGPGWRGAALALDGRSLGLNALLKGAEVTEIPLGGPGPFADADTPEEWAALTEKNESPWTI